MYIVASTWEINGGHEEEAEKRGLAMRRIMKGQAGIEFIKHFPTGGSEIMVLVGYKDEATYHRIIDDPNGPFQKGLQDVKLEEAMTWKQSWRGEAFAE